MPQPTEYYEQSILGSMLIEPKTVGNVLAQLRPEDFPTPIYRAIYRVIARLFRGGTPVDPVTVLHAGEGAYDAKLLQELMQITPTAANALHHCKALQETVTLNRLASLGEQLAHGADSLQVAGEIADQINGLFVQRRSASIITAAEAAERFLVRHAPEANRPEYIPMGLPEITKVLRAEAGDFIILGGAPSSGKTLLAMQMMATMATKYRVGFFSLETGEKRLTDRFMAHMARIALGRIKDNDLSDDDWVGLCASGSRMASLNLELISAAGMSTDDILALALSRRYQIIVIDYVQLIASRERDRYTAVTKISMALHTLCQRHGITCLALAQLSRAEKVGGKPVPPDMSSLRESGQLEQDADAILLLYPSDPNDNKSNRILKIGKNKDGDRLKMELRFDGATQTLEPIPETPGQHFAKVQKEIKQAGKASAEGQPPRWVQDAMQGTALPF